MCSIRVASGCDDDLPEITTNNGFNQLCLRQKTRAPELREGVWFSAHLMMTVTTGRPASPRFRTKG